MLDIILLAFKKGRIITYDDLANVMNADINFIEAVINQLLVMGYIKKSVSCDGGCRRSCSGCEDSYSQVSIWELTNKGNKYIENRN